MLSLHGIMGASIAVEDHDITIFPNGTVNENSTKTANTTEENVQETRAIDIVTDVSIFVESTNLAIYYNIYLIYYSR